MVHCTTRGLGLRDGVGLWASAGTIIHVAGGCVAPHSAAWSNNALCWWATRRPPPHVLVVLCWGSCEHAVLGHALIDVRHRDRTRSGPWTALLVDLS